MIWHDVICQRLKELNKANSGVKQPLNLSSRPNGCAAEITQHSNEIIGPQGEAEVGTIQALFECGKTKPTAAVRGCVSVCW